MGRGLPGRLHQGGANSGQVVILAKCAESLSYGKGQLGNSPRPNFSALIGSKFPKFPNLQIPNPYGRIFSLFYLPKKRKATQSE